MKRAVDNYDLGKQKEVYANDFRGLSIPSYSRRFTCPECGEYLSLVNRYDAEPYFRHTNRTDASPYCDERVDGRSNLTIYERVGLPIYIKSDNAGQYSLFIGFYALGGDVLGLAQKSGIFAAISDLSSTRYHVKYNIDCTSFYSDKTTLQPISFIPPNGCNYKIQYIGDSSVSQLIKKKWSDYSDGFTQYGAIFTYQGDGGRKIKRGDSITTGVEYLWVAPVGHSMDFKGLTREKQGTLSLLNKDYDVLKICFMHNGVNNQDFSRFANFCRDYLKVTLLYKEPEIIPIWPPCTQMDNMYSTFPSVTELFCTVNSGNETPAVYEYYSNGVNALKVDQTSSGKKYRRITCSNYNKPIGVDRKFAGNIVFVNRHFPVEIGERNIILFNGQEATLGQQTEIPLNAKLLIQTNYRGEVLHIKRDYQIIRAKFNEKEIIEVNGITSGDKLLFRNTLCQLAYLWYPRKHVQNDKKGFINYKLSVELNRARGPCVATPPWVYRMLRNTQIDSSCYKLIRRYVVGRSIPLEALNLLNKARKDALNE